MTKSGEALTQAFASGDPLQVMTASSNIGLFAAFGDFSDPTSATAVCYSSSYHSTPYHYNIELLSNTCVCSSQVKTFSKQIHTISLKQGGLKYHHHFAAQLGHAKNVSSILCHLKRDKSGESQSLDSQQQIHNVIDYLQQKRQI